MTEPDNISESTAELPSAETTPRKPSLFATTALVLVLVTLCILVWQWLNTRHHFTELEQTLTQRLEQYSANNQQSLAISKQADAHSTEAAART